MMEKAPGTDRHWLDAMLRHARQRANVIALRDAVGRNCTWGELSIAVEQCASQLEGNRRITRQIANTVDDVVVAIACLAAGVTEVAIDARLPEDMRQEMICQSEAAPFERTCLLSNTAESSQPGNMATPAAIERLSQRADRISIHEESLILWTSGTTSHPRGVMLSPHNLLTNALAKLKAVPQAVEDHRLTVLPISHAYARTCDMGTWLLSGSSWTIDMGSAAINRIETNRAPTHINCVPSIASRILSCCEAEAQAFGKLRVLGCGGASMPAEMFARFREQDIDVIQGYGCTETSPVIFSASLGDTHPGSVGPAVEGWDISVRDGRLFVRGDGVMLGYLNDVEATSKKIDEEGWLDTGDLVEADERGWYRILGRADDVIVLSNGFKIHPQSIEAMLNQISTVDHSIVVQKEQELVIGIQASKMSQSSELEPILTELSRHLPPRTKYRVAMIDPVLSHEANELTVKGTIRREIAARRLH